jgi:hypothetical protein
MNTEREQIVYVRGDDWEGVYVNGILKVEGHDTHNELRDIILGMAGDVVDFKMMDADLDWLEEVGNLPKSIDDVVEDAE